MGLVPARGGGRGDALDVGRRSSGSICNFVTPRDRQFAISSFKVAHSAGRREGLRLTLENETSTELFPRQIESTLALTDARLIEPGLNFLECDDSSVLNRDHVWPCFATSSRPQ